LTNSNSLVVKAMAINVNFLDEKTIQVYKNASGRNRPGVEAKAQAGLMRTHGGFKPKAYLT